MVLSRSLGFSCAVLAGLLTLAAVEPHAAPAFENISQGEFDNISRELSANGAWHTVTPPSSMGSIFGFEVGVSGGLTNTPNINTYVQEVSPDTDAKRFPHGTLYAAVTVPLGLTVEAMALPEIDANGFNYQQFGAALKWVPTDTILEFMPVNIALRGFATRSKSSFTQTLREPTLGNISVDATVNYEGQVAGLQAMVSPKLLPIIEPYVGIGIIKASSKMDVSGPPTASIFLDGQSKESSPSTTQIFAGAEVRLGPIAVGAEYSRMFETDTFTGKMAIKF